jgi:phosphate-selective porin OprO/OprP
MQACRRRPCSWSLILGVCAALAGFNGSAWAQAPFPTTPALRPELPPAPTFADELAERLRALEEKNKKLTEQLEQSNKEHDQQLKDLLGKYEEVSKQKGAKEAGADADRPDDSAGRRSQTSILPDDGGTPVPDYTEGLFGPYRNPVGYPDASATTTGSRIPLIASFGPGFRLQSEDQRYRLEIHYESQIEGRDWAQTDQIPAHNGIYLPRQRFFFSGNITEPIEYELAINRGLNNINLLNAFINLHIDDSFEIRFGRFFTPVLYEQYAISNYWLLTPERSLFSTNLGLNRQLGVMAWGYLFDKRLDYAVGLFNGSRNSFENLSNAMDVTAYLNTRPFQESEALPFARFLNLGASAGWGHQDQPPSPAAFRIGAGSPDTNIPGVATVPFLILNPDVIENGDRLVGSAHAAYFYKGLSLIGEWQYGFGGYASPLRQTSAQVPFSGYYVTAGYFLTGEEVERRTRVKPRRPLVPTSKDEARGIGAVEVTSRVSEVRLSDKIFTNGFADPNIWSNSAVTTEVGVNWYWNEYLKFYTFWLHGEFGDPVQYKPGDEKKTADMLWLRCQLYF